MKTKKAMGTTGERNTEITTTLARLFKWIIFYWLILIIHIIEYLNFGLLTKNHSTRISFQDEYNMFSLHNLGKVWKRSGRHPACRDVAPLDSLKVDVNCF